jgi:hypothetical protein
MPALTLLVALLFVAMLRPIRPVSETLADDSANRPCTDRPAEMSLHAFVDQFRNYADAEESSGPTGSESAPASGQQTTPNSTVVERGVGLLPGIIASLERRFKAAALSSDDRRQPAAAADGRSMLSRLADVLARYGLRLPAGLLQASSLHPNDICSRVNADRMRREIRALYFLLFQLLLFRVCLQRYAQPADRDSNSEPPDLKSSVL